MNSVDYLATIKAIFIPDLLVNQTNMPFSNQLLKVKRESI